VSVPKSHTIGHVERPRSWFGLFQEKETDENAFRIQTLLTLSREQIIAALQQDADSLLLFVHGYNVTFDEAIFKAAQIAYDSNFQGSVLVFSWPSMGGLFKYDYDYQSALFSPGHLLSVLSMITHEIGNKKIFVVAHSLGNQILVDALQQAALGHVALNISELVLAAPDVDKDVFLSKAQQIKSVAGNITLYASSSDKALLASDKKTWGLRLGYIGAGGPILINGVETIDVSTLGDDMFGLNHGTFSDNKVALDDLGRLITSGIHPPGVRSPILRYVPDRLHTLYWMYPK
jgi:esterase/lipase superfamily enzyme